MSRKSWDQHWYERVRHNGEMSTCRGRHVGGVLVKDNRVIADGMNGNLPKLLHCDRGGCARCADKNIVSGIGLERCVCCHAEQNIISYCAKNGVSTMDSTLYLPASPCLDCIKLVILSGIKEIVYKEPYGPTHQLVEDLCIQSSVQLRKFNC